MIATGTRADGSKVEFEFINEYVYADNNQLTKLVVPEGCKRVHADNNQLTELVIPEGCKYVDAGNNQLTELVIPEGCKYVYADNNPINGGIITFRGEQRRLLCADGYTNFIDSTKSRGDIQIHKARYMDHMPYDQLEKCYIAQHGEIYAHGSTAKEAIADLRLKLDSERDKQEHIDAIKRTGYVTREQYRHITGACSEGVRMFCKEHGIKGDRISLKRVLEITKDAYGGREFAKAIGDSE